MASGSLSGRVVVVAASEDRVQRLARGLREKGATVIPFPTVRLIPPRDLGALDRALRAWPSYDWAIFTSAHGVEAVVTRAKELGLDLRRPRGKIAAVGPATKRALEDAGLPVDAVPDEFLTDRIVPVLGDLRGKRVFLPRSRLARRSLTQELLRRGAIPIEVDAYDAVPAAPDLEVLRRASRVDFLLFTSASAVSNFASIVPAGLLERLKVSAEAACIGPVTAGRARALGFRVTVTAQTHTIPGLIESLAEGAHHG